MATRSKQRKKRSRKRSQVQQQTPQLVSFTVRGIDKQTSRPFEYQVDASTEQQAIDFAEITLNWGSG